MGRMPVPDRLSFTAGRMPSLRAMGGYPAFPPAISLSGVGCIRVTHPCATLAPRRTLTVRLACIRPAASVHPEPGSNSSLYYCCTSCYFLNLGFRCVPCLPGGPGRRAPPPVACFSSLCWPQTFKERKTSLLRQPLSLPFCGCKSTTFPQTHKHFFHLFRRRKSGNRALRGRLFAIVLKKNENLSR